MPTKTAESPSTTAVPCAREVALHRPDQPLVSVIIPCYNKARFLAEAIESVLSQTYRNVETIVINDGSPDNTAEIASRYAAVRYLYQENQRVPKARNVGLSTSGGDFVIFLDADDRLTPSAVQAHLACFSEHPEAGFVVGDIDQVDEDGSYMYSPRYPVLTCNFYEELLKVNHIANTMAVMFRRSVIEQLGGFTANTNGAEDYELLLRAARLCPSAHHRNVVAHYRRYDTSQSRKGVRMLRAMHQVMGWQEPFVRSSPRLRAAARTGIAYWRDHFGHTTVKEIVGNLRRGNVSRALTALAGLMWYVRGRVLLFPPRYAGRLFRQMWRLLHSRARPRASINECSSL